MDNYAQKTYYSSSITTRRLNDWLRDERIPNRATWSSKDHDHLKLEKQVGKKKTTARWIFSWKKGVKKFDIGLGTFPKYELRDLEATILQYNKELSDGLNPKVEKAKREEAARLAERAQERENQIQRTLGQYIDGLWGESQMNNRSGEAMVSTMKTVFADMLDERMDEITQPMIRRWQAWMHSANNHREKPATYATVHRRFKTLKQIVRHSMENQGWPEKDPFTNPKIELLLTPKMRELERQRKGDTRRYPWEPDVQKRIMVGVELLAQEKYQERCNTLKHNKGKHLISEVSIAAPHWFIPMFWIAYYTGLRPSDVRTLIWGRELDIWREGYLIKMPEKTKDHPDPKLVKVGIPPTLKHILEEWFRQSKGVKNSWVFPTADRRSHRPKGCYRNAWAKVLAYAGIEGKFDFYSTRHNYASQLIAAGYSLKEVADLLGHKTTEMVEKHYGHLLPERRHQAAMVMERINQGIIEGEFETVSDDTSLLIEQPLIE